MDDYDIPFDGMSEDEFMYRAMNENDPMYMGGQTYVSDEYVQQADNDYEQRYADWYESQYNKILDACDKYMADDDQDPRQYFDDIEFYPFS